MTCPPIRTRRVGRGPWRPDEGTGHWLGGTNDLSLRQRPDPSAVSFSPPAGGCRWIWGDRIGGQVICSPPIPMTLSDRQVSRASRSCGWSMGKEAQVNRSRGLDGESKDSRQGRPRPFAHHFGMHRQVSLKRNHTCQAPLTPHLRPHRVSVVSENAETAGS